VRDEDPEDDARDPDDAAELSDELFDEYENEQAELPTRTSSKTGVVKHSQAREVTIAGLLSPGESGI
jgi:hypothetical protein